MPYGPPVKGAPWLGRSLYGGIGSGTSNPVLPPSPPAPPLPPGVPSMNKPFLARIPDKEPRTRHFFDVVSNIVNSLLGKGQLTLTGTDSYALDITGGTGLTGTFP